MESEGIFWGGVLRDRFVPRNLLGRRNDLRGRDRKRRHVQRLANVASGPILRTTTRVVMQKGAATREVQQCQAAKHRQRRTEIHCSQVLTKFLHTLAHGSLHRWTPQIHFRLQTIYWHVSAGLIKLDPATIPT